MIEETMKAYLAGCIDCDGSIGIKRSTYHMRVRGDARQPVFSERVLFAQVKPEITLLLKEYFGGSYAVYKPGTPRSKPIYRWQVTDKQAVELIRTILPFLTIKRRQALVALELRRLKELPKVASGSFTMTNRWGAEIVMPRCVVSPEVMAAKEALFLEIKQLNDVRAKQPQLIGTGLSGEEVKHKRHR
jgi:hypothetical protein